MAAVAAAALQMWWRLAYSVCDGGLGSSAVNVVEANAACMMDWLGLQRRQKQKWKRKQKRKQKQKRQLARREMRMEHAAIPQCVAPVNSTRPPLEVVN